MLTVDHVHPIEEWVDDEHDRVQPDFETFQFGTKVDHQKPVESEGDGNEADRKIADFVRSCDDGEDHDKEEQCSGSNGVVHEADDTQEGIPHPQAYVRQHTDLVRDEAKKPSPPLLQKAFVRLNSFSLAKSPRTHLDLISLSGTDHEKVSEPTIFTQMAFAIVEKIVTLFRFVCEIVFRHFPKGRKSQHGQRARETGNGAAAGLDGPLEQLSMDVFHVL